MATADLVATARTPRRWRFLTVGGAATALALGALPLVALAPLLSPGLPDTHDGLYHIFRAVQLEISLREGDLYPRWAPDFVQGLGYPVFNFYAPLLNYLLVALHQLGLTFVDALKASIALAFFAAGVGTYLFSRGPLGQQGALLAAAAYVYAPFLLMEAYVRADVPEQLALAWLPFVLLAFRRLVEAPSAGRLGVAAVAYAALVLTHNLTAFFFSPFLLLYVVLSLALRRAWRTAPAALLGLALGVGLSAFYWLPALGEQGWVQIERAINEPGFDFRDHFLPVEQMLSPQPACDLREGNAWPEHRLGVSQVVLAVFGLAAMFRRGLPSQARWHLALFALAAVLLGFLMTEAATGVWEAVPYLAFLQFPWRLLGMASLAVAFVAGGAALWLPGTPAALGGGGRARLAAVVLGLTAFLLPLPMFTYLYPTGRAEVPANPTIADAVAHEVRTRSVGTTTRGEYLPVWVKWLQTDVVEGAAAGAYKRGERLDRGVLDPTMGVTASLVRQRGNYEAYEVESPREATLLFRLLYYPAWRAYVDGREVVARPFELYGQGWTLVDVPAGRHLLELRFEATPLVKAGNAIGLATAMLAAALLVVPARRRLRRLRRPAWRTGARDASLQAAPCLAVAAAMVLLFAAKALYIDVYTDWFSFRSPFGTAAKAQYKAAVSFGDEMLFLGFDVGRQAVKPGEPVRVRLYWEPIRPLTVDYGSFVEMVPELGKPAVARSEGLYAKWIPTTAWRTGFYYRDSQELLIPAHVQPGEYLLVLGLYEGQSGRRLVVSGSQPPRDYAVMDRLLILP